MSSQLALPGIGGRLTRVGLTLPKRLTFEQWEKAGQYLAQIESGLSWAIGDWYNYGKGKYGERAEQAAVLAEENGLKLRTVQEYGYVASRYEITSRLENLSWLHHQRAASQKDRLKWLERAEKESWTSNELRSQIRSEVLKALPLPKGRFPVLYADPPWAFANSGFEQSAESVYPTMTTEQICELEDENGRKVQAVAADRAVLFLWVPASLRDDAKRVIDAWGFEYKTDRIWVKDKSPGMGWYVRTVHEELLIATRGESMFPKVELPSVFEAPVTKHSQKPVLVYSDIEAMYDGPYLELFARAKRTGWRAWGNQV
jgi:N6-adenosine-specific RNA methylase IME4